MKDKASGREDQGRRGGPPEHIGIIVHRVIADIAAKRSLKAVRDVLNMIRVRRDNTYGPNQT
jgi:hypothetical protein